MTSYVCAPLCKHNVIHKTGSAKSIALSSQKEPATATRNMLYVWFLRYASGPTYRQTDRHAGRNTSQPFQERSMHCGIKGANPQDNKKKKSVSSAD